MSFWKSFFIAFFSSIAFGIFVGWCVYMQDDCLEKAIKPAQCNDCIYIDSGSGQCLTWRSIPCEVEVCIRRE